MKKSAIKNGNVTRTVTLTNVRYLSVDIETREVKEETEILVLKYDEQEAELALREQGKNVAAILGVGYVDVKISVDYLTFFSIGHLVD